MECDPIRDTTDRQHGVTTNNYIKYKSMETDSQWFLERWECLGCLLTTRCHIHALEMQVQVETNKHTRTHTHACLRMYHLQYKAEK